MAGDEMTHRELIEELVEVLEAIDAAVAPTTLGTNELSMIFRKARAVLEKAKVIEDCIPLDDAAEAAASQR